MPVATPTSVGDVLTALRAHVPNDLALGPVCTRVMLRTGVNLRAPRPDQERDAALIAKARGVLAEMGYQV